MGRFLFPIEGVSPVLAPSQEIGMGRFIFDGDGKIALVPLESKEYRHLEADKKLTQLAAMRNRGAFSYVRVLHDEILT